MTEENKRKIVIPGETIVEGDGYLPGEGTEKRGNKIVAQRFGLSEESDNLVKVIAISGPYIPRRGNTVVGKVVNVLANGWLIDVGYAENAFLSLMEVPRFVNKDALEEVMEIGDMMAGKIWNISKRGIDLSIKQRGFGRISQGIIMKVNPNKVPRIIGKEGSMIKLIKDETHCEITVGQNGFIWINGENVEDEIFARRAIDFVSDKSYIHGLTEVLTKWLSENKK